MTLKNASAQNSYAELLEEAAIAALIKRPPGHEYAANHRLFQGIPSVTVTPRGRLWATWYSGGQGEGPLNYTFVATSGDRGTTWSEPVLVIDPPGKVRACDPMIWCDPMGRVWLFWSQVHTLHDGRAGVWTSVAADSENPETDWSEPRRLADGVMLGSPIETKDGAWLFPISTPPAAFLNNEVRMVPTFLRTDVKGLVSPSEQDQIDARAGAHVYRFCPESSMLIRVGTARVPVAETHNEHMLVEKQSGTLWMLLRTSYGIAESFSHDQGQTWSTPKSTGWPHPSSRFFFNRLRSGNILLVKHGPLEPLDFSMEQGRRKREDLMAFLSTDDGETWQGELLIMSGHCSYPSATQDSDGTIYCIFDRNRRGSKEILLTRFTEADVLSAESGVSASVDQLLVNQATGVITPENDWAQFKGEGAVGRPLIFTGI